MQATNQASGYQVEILGPSGVVLYTRPINHQLVADALKTPGYAVRWPGCRDMRKLDDLPANCKAEISLSEQGLTASCSRREPRPCKHCGTVHLPGCSVHCDY